MEASDLEIDTVSDCAAAAESLFSSFTTPSLNVLKALQTALLSQICAIVWGGKVRRKWIPVKIVALFLDDKQQDLAG